MEKISFIERIKRSYTDKYFYKQYLKEQTSRAILFVLAMLILLSIPKIIWTNISLKQDLNEITAVFTSDDFPGFTYTDNQLVSNTGESFKHEFDGIGVIIDTVGNYSVADLEDYYVGILVDTDVIIIHINGAEYDRLYFSDIPEDFVTESTLADYMNSSLLFTSFYLVANVSAIIGIFFLLGIIGFYATFITNMYSKSYGITGEKGFSAKIGLYSLILPITIYQVTSLIPYLGGIVSLVILMVLSTRTITRTLTLIKEEGMPEDHSKDADFTPNVRDYVDLEDKAPKDDSQDE